jgi:thiol-disulfide isomerase/thioredoxin
MKRKSASSFQALLFVTVLGVGCLAQSSPVSPGCEAAPEVRKALDQLPQYRQDPALTDWQVYQQRLAGLKALMRQYPSDVFVQQTYIQSTTSLRQVDKVSVEEKAKATAEYKTRYEQNPGDVQLEYLYALTLISRDTPEAIKLFDAALEKDASFALPHLSLVHIYRSPVFLDKEKSAAHLKSILDACPATLDAYQPLANIENKDVLTTYAGKLRALVESRADVDAVGAYRTLWSIEFKARSTSEYDTLRAKVGQDLARIRQLNMQDQRNWYETLEEGYKLTNDKKDHDWAEAQRNKRFPHAGYLADREQWLKDHPSPDAGASPDTRKAYFRDLLAQTNQWLKERPDSILGNFEIYGERLDAMSHLDDVPAADEELAVEQRLKFAGENGGGTPWSTDHSPWAGDYSYAAAILSKKHLAPERVVEFAQKALPIMEVDAKEPIPDLYATKENVENNKFYNSYGRVEMLGYEIDGYLQLKQAEKAEPLLAQAEQWLQDLKQLAGNDDGRKQTYAQQLAHYWGLRAQEAELNGRKLDAMGFYENALLARLDAQVKPASDEKDELAENAHQLWASLGGTESGWQLWYGRRANDLANRVMLAWENTNQPFPAFELADLSDRHWNLESLKGKVTFVGFWATWCGPCREEMPHLQKLIDHYKDHAEVQFITLNMDDNPGLIQPFLKEHELSLVVIPALTYISDTLKVNGIPQSWIVDENNVVRRKAIGYGRAEEWVKGMESAIEEVKSGAATTPAVSTPQSN